MDVLKSYVKFDIHNFRKKLSSIRNITDCGDHSIAKLENGVYFKFDDDGVIVYGPFGDGNSTTHTDISSIISTCMNGGIYRGSILIQVYGFHISCVKSDIDLAMLNHMLSIDPPSGMSENILYPHDDELLVKMEHYIDGFTITYHINSSGATRAVCNTSRCKYNFSDEDVIRRRLHGTTQKLIDIMK